MAPHVPSDTSDSHVCATSYLHLLIFLKALKALQKSVHEGKKTEVELGCDGALVAHPSMIAACRSAFDEFLGPQPNQIDRIDVCDSIALLISNRIARLDTLVQQTY